MILTTTPTIQGRTIARYHGIVNGEAIMGANIVRDIFAAVTDIVGGRSGQYEKKLAEARGLAMEEMKSRAMSMGANAVVGIDVDYEVVGQGMLMVAISGTAVTVE